MTSSTAVAPREEAAVGVQVPNRVNDLARQAKVLAGSTIVPESYRNNVGNCFLALEMADRIKIPVMTVVQNLHLIQGRPSWGSSFLIGAVNACGRFSPLRFEEEGEEGKAGWRCRAVATSREDGAVLPGTWITWEMVEAEGWSKKTGSKWKTMPGQMMKYRSAAFWARTYAPEISLGMLTSEEAEDITPARQERVRGLAAALDAPDVVEAEVITPAALLRRFIDDSDLDFEERARLETVLASGDEEAIAAELNEGGA